MSLLTALLEALLASFPLRLWLLLLVLEGDGAVCSSPTLLSSGLPRSVCCACTSPSSDRPLIGLSGGGSRLLLLLEPPWLMLVSSPRFALCVDESTKLRAGFLGCPIH